MQNSKHATRAAVFEILKSFFWYYFASSSKWFRATFIEITKRGIYREISPHGLGFESTPPRIVQRVQNEPCDVRIISSIMFQVCILCMAANTR